MPPCWPPDFRRALAAEHQLAPITPGIAIPDRRSAPSDAGAGRLRDSRGAAVRRAAAARRAARARHRPLGDQETGRGMRAGKAATGSTALGRSGGDADPAAAPAIPRPSWPSDYRCTAVRLLLFLALLDLRPRVAQRHRAVEDQLGRGVNRSVDAEVALPLELEPALGRRRRQARLDAAVASALPANWGSDCRDSRPPAARRRGRAW